MTLSVLLRSLASDHSSQVDPGQVLAPYVEEWTETGQGGLVELVQSLIRPVGVYSLRPREIVMPLMREIAHGPQISDAHRDPIHDVMEGGKCVCPRLSQDQRAHVIHTLLVGAKSKCFEFKIDVYSPAEVTRLRKQKSRRRKEVVDMWIAAFFVSYDDGKTFRYEGNKDAVPSLKELLGSIVAFPKDCRVPFDVFCSRFAHTNNLSMQLDVAMTSDELQKSLIDPIAELIFPLNPAPKK